MFVLIIQKNTPIPADFKVYRIDCFKCSMHTSITSFSLFLLKIKKLFLIFKKVEDPLFPFYDICKEIGDFFGV